MKNQLNRERTVRVFCNISETDVYEMDTVAILWGLDRGDLIRIAIKKFLNEPTLDFYLDTKEKKETLRANK